MENNNGAPKIKKTLAIFSLTCCEGCEFALLKDYAKFNELLSFYDLKNFRLGQEYNHEGPYDISLVEGTPESTAEFKLLTEIRAESKFVAALGACAHMGGIQSQRNCLPQKLIGRDHVKTLSEVIKIDYVLPGCPIDQNEVVNFLLDFYWDKDFHLPDLGVCFECRQNQNPCLLKEGKPCLGPITRAGCNSVCVNGGEMCLGCRGPLEQANFLKIKEMLIGMVGEQETKNLLTIYGDYEKIWQSYQKKDK